MSETVDKPKRILILRSTDHIFDKTDYGNYQPVQGENTGNKLWLMGLISTISGSNCAIEFEENRLDPGYINEQYDMCIKPSANLFGETFEHYLESHVKRYSGVNIPIHVIAVGAQAKSYDDLDDLAEKIKPSAVRFIESIEKTGGLFALRGYFTDALLRKYGYNNAYVTGCPSLFQLGPIEIIKHKILDNELKTAFNGNLKLCYNYIIRQKNCGEFFDQSVFFNAICGDINSFSYDQLLKKYGLYGARLLLNKKIQLLIDMPDWMNYLKTEGFNFSFGTRIHGSIMPILSGIPALVIPPDTRVREMCEFFDIPTITNKEVKHNSLLDLYDRTDYSVFNSNFQKKLQYYIEFLKRIGIEYNSDNLFFKQVINNCHAMTQGFDDYKERVDNIKENKILEYLYSFKEMGKTILKLS